MKIVGTIESLWRYPVKGMRGEEVPQAFIGFAGVYGDRCYAFKNSAGRAGFPYLSAPGQPAMLQYQPRFLHPERTIAPPNLAEAQAIAPGVTPVNAGPNDLDLDIIVPSGSALRLDDPALLGMLVEGLRGENQLSLVRSDRALTDCRPLSLIALQTIDQVSAEVGRALDKRRFRANIHLDLTDGVGFGEDALVGKRLSLGAKAQVMVLERDPRCKAISLDPETGEHDPNIFRSVAQLHGADAGVYCAVLVEGMVKTWDVIAVLD